MGAIDGPLIIWQPQPGPQTHLLTCPVFEVFYGGARGGGKTDGMLGEWVAHAHRYGDRASGLMVRRTRTELYDTIERSRQLYTLIGAKFNEQDKLWRFPNGARLRFAYLERDADAANYQGHNYCVAVGTQIRMANGTTKAIELIQPGEQVQTLEGPKRVTATVTPYLAPCVRALVRGDDGEILGSQIHPVWHPVLTSAGLSESRNNPRRQSAWQRLRAKFVAGKQGQGLGACERPGLPAWFAWSEGGRSGCKASLHSRRDAAQPESLSVHVALHAPSAPSKDGRPLVDPGESIVSPARGRWLERWLGLPQECGALLSGLLRLGAPALSGWGRADLVLPNARGYGLSDFQLIPNSQSYCPSGHCSCDVRARARSEIAQGDTPSLADAGSKRLAGLWGEWGTTQQRSRSLSPSWVHPYTGEARNLAEPATIGTMELSWHGEALVTDLCVEDANHYISDTGLINKNTRVYVEEIGNFPNSAPIMKLMATLRSSAGVPCRFRATGNPGGPGHHWVKARYIDPAPQGYQIIRDGGLDRVYIPAKVMDNHALMQSDPTYVDRLRMSGSPELVRAWLEGDWSVIAGAFFPEFSIERHVVQPFELPAHWTRIRAADWGSARPFSVGWYAVSDGTLPAFPRGAMIKYREWYGMQDGQPNVGVKMPAEQVADGIKEREIEKVTLGVMDPAAFASDGGPSIAERMSTRGVQFMRADNKRVTQAGALGGWDQLRARLIGDDAPMLYFFSTCVHTIRTLPALQHDEHKPEDVDTEAEDHAADETRYACMARPWVKDAPQGQRSIESYRFGAQMTFNELRDSVRRRRQEA